MKCVADPGLGLIIKLMVTIIILNVGGGGGGGGVQLSLYGRCGKLNGMKLFTFTLSGGHPPPEGCPAFASVHQVHE